MTLKEISSEYGIDAKLLKQYFQAFANLYGICPIQKAKQIFNRQNPTQKLTDAQIIGFADNYVGDWKILSPDQVYSDVPRTTPMHREIVSKALVYNNNFDAYYFVCSHQANKDYYVPEKDVLIRYAQRGYYEETPHTAAMAQLLREVLHLNDWQQALSDLIWQLRMDASNFQTFMESYSHGVLNFEEAKKAIQIYTNLHNNTRNMLNRGYTPTELSRKSNPQGLLPKSIVFGPGLQEEIRVGRIDPDAMIHSFAGMNLPPELRQSLISETEKAKQPKPGRNDSCPCGSGKKYKKCCGR